jgi:hypothetical protein
MYTRMDAINVPENFIKDAVPGRGIPLNFTKGPMPYSVEADAALSSLDREMTFQHLHAINYGDAASHSDLATASSQTFWQKSKTQSPGSSLEISPIDGVETMVIVDKSLVNDLESALGLPDNAFPDDDSGSDSSQNGKRYYFLQRIQQELDDFVGYLIMEFSGRRAGLSESKTPSIPHAYPLAELIQYFKFLRSGALKGQSPTSGTTETEAQSIDTRFYEQRKLFWEGQGGWLGFSLTE